MSHHILPCLKFFNEKLAFYFLLDKPKLPRQVFMLSKINLCKLICCQKFKSLEYYICFVNVTGAKTPFGGR